MKIKILFLVLFALSANVAFGQSSADKRRIEKLKENLVANDELQKIKKNKEDCEALVGRLKKQGKTTSDLKKQYQNAKNDYDVVIDALISDINKANTIGGLAEQLILTNSRRDKYAELSEKGKASSETFMENAKRALGDEKTLVVVIINWAADNFLPGWVTKISNASLEVVRKILVDKIEETRFSSWDNVK
jgi:hypothetical protein